MRRTKSQQFRFTYASSILLILVLTLILFSISAVADDGEGLIIILFDSSGTSWEPLDDNILLEGNDYDIVVKHENELTPAYNVTITITAFGEVYVTSTELPWVTIETPNFEEYSEFVITAAKEGYASAEQYVIVSKGDLFVSMDRDTVEEEGSFSVTITDQYDTPISGVTVYVEGHESVFDTTNDNGKAYINAPEVDANTEISITVVKSGYYYGYSMIHVENVKATGMGDFLSKIFEVSPIVFALFVVFFAMLFVKLRKKTSIPISIYENNVSQKNKKFVRDKKELWSAKSLSKKPMKQTDKKVDRKLPASAKGPRVEVIRIHSREDKKKETKHISDKKKSKKVVSLNKNDEYEWFNGTEHMKYKIDKLTGDVNEKPADKWFVGEDTGRFKVDKKLIDKKLKKDPRKNTA
ncbi:MAG: hypothetical protein KAI20_00015 [Thermoplasmatales archaeon]|nr:hypothetical protein [Thermoplasmatales archaeon]